MGRSRSLLSVIVTLAALALLSGNVAEAAPAAQFKGERIVRITHAVTAPTAVIGTGLGTVRTFMVPTVVNGKANAGNYLTGTLTTVAVGLANDQELRASDLTFVVRTVTNQLVVGGVSLYATQAGVLSVGQTTTRPVVGGSGIYAGARGYVVTTNMGDAGWKHVFHLS
jgi:hypothetical protein